MTDPNDALAEQSIREISQELESETRRANAAEAELREVAGELEAVKAQGFGYLRRLGAAIVLLELARDAIDEACYPVWWEQLRRLGAAIVLLELARDAIDEACYPVWWEQWRAFLYVTPSPPAEPAPRWRVGTETLEEWRTAAKAVGVSSPGGMQQAKHMAVAACEALGLKYDETSPADIREAVYAESAPEKKAEPAPSLVDQIEAVLDERWRNDLRTDQAITVVVIIDQILRAAREAGGR